MKKILLLCVFVLLAITEVFANDYPTKVVDGKTYYVYTVEAGDGLYAIGRKFSVTQAELHDANPGLVAEIQVGDTLLVPVKEGAKVGNTSMALSTDHIVKHTVLPKQTLYAISKIYGVSIESIKELNPGCEDGVKIGDILRIPVTKSATSTSTKSNERTTPSKKTKQHVVKNGESLYKICKMYDVDINDVFSCNPGLTDRLKDGQIILIPIDNSEVTNTIGQPKVTASQKSAAIQSHLSADGEYVLYTVKKGETISSIAKKFNMTAKELLNLNPVYKQRNLNAGDKVMLPKNSKTSSSTEATPEVNERLSSMTTGTGRMSYAPVGATSVPASATSGVSAYNEELPSWSSRTPISEELNVVILLPLMASRYDAENSSERFVSFYRGILVALNELKQQGISLNVHTYDIAKDTATLASVLAEPAVRSADLIIGPAFKNQVPMVSRFSRKHKIYTVVPFTPHIAYSDLHEYMFKFNPSWDEFYSVVAENIVKKSDKQKFALVTFADRNQKGDCLYKSLEIALKKRSIPYDQLVIDSNNADSINIKLGSARRNVVICSSDRTSARLVVDNMDESHRMNCTLWGFEEWSMLFKGMNNGYYFTLFTPQPSNTYVEKYTEWFGDRLTGELPHYDLLGYDVMIYFGNAIKKLNGVVRVMEPNVQSKMLQSHFYFVKDNYRKNYVNINHCFVHWNGYSFSSPICYR